jgi:hypothetical protein
VLHRRRPRHRDALDGRFLGRGPWFPSGQQRQRDGTAEHHHQPQGRQTSFLKDLSDYTAILNKAIDRMTALPPISDPVGKVAYETYLGKYTSARDRLVAAKAQLDKAARTDYAAQNGAIKALETAQEEGLSVVDPVGAIEGSPTLGTASAFAPECKKVA